MCPRNTSVEDSIISKHITGKGPSDIVLKSFKKKKKKQNSSQIKSLSLRSWRKSWQILKSHALDPHFTGRENQICPPKTQPVSDKVWCSPVWTQGDVEQNEKHCSYYGCQERSHPGAKLAEVTILHNGDQNRATHKHGVLQQRERAQVSFFLLTTALLHINAGVN